MAERPGPNVYSIAAHRGFADALVAGLVPRYSDPDLGLAKLTLLVPSARAARTLSEAFVRQSGAGLLMPRMAVVGDLDLDETLGALLDPLGAGESIPPAADPTRRWLRLAEIVRDVQGVDAPKIGSVLRMAFQLGRTMDRLLVEDIGPGELVGERVLDLLGDLAGHWQDSLRLLIAVQDRWLAELIERGEVDAPDRRNRLFRHLRTRWRAEPPPGAVVAAGVTSASPALGRLLRTVAELPHGAVVLPDLDLSMSDEVWDELGSATTPFERGEAVTHPQYHLKLLLGRMGVARSEVMPWHRAGLGKGPPERSHAISNLFLPPEASKAWVTLPAEKRRLAGVRLMETANPEEEAQSIALLVREALEQPERRIAVITPDRGLAARIVQHLRRWNIEADDSAGRPLGQTPAGRLFLHLAEVAAEQAAPVPLMALFGHPLVRAGEARGDWLEQARAFELALRGPRKEPGLKPPRGLAEAKRLGPWWQEVETILTPLLTPDETLAGQLDALAGAGEALCGEGLWAREDGRALGEFVDDLRRHAREIGTGIEAGELPAMLREAMDRVAVRPPYGGHPRVAIYGLLESRMTRAELVICAGLNEGTWPGSAAPDPLLAPAVLRALGVPGSDFRIGLSAHDLAGALGAPEVVLSRARRDAAGPAIPSRFWLRVAALLGDDLLEGHRETRAPELAQALDLGPPTAPHPRPQPLPTPEQRKVRVSVTALDRLRSDPFQFYAQAILRLRELDALDAEPSPAWRGEVAHKVLERWHKEGRPLAQLAEEELRQMNAHPLMRALWRPRLLKALEWIETQIAAEPDRVPTVFEQGGEIVVKGVIIRGKADRIDMLAGGELAIVDYKTGAPPTGREVEAGYALQLGTLGLMARAGAFGGVAGEPTRFEYWSLGSSKTSGTGFGYVTTPILEGRKQRGIPRADFLPEAARFLGDALGRWILGDEPFTARLNPDAPGYSTYDQLMRLDEWIAELK
ncbi:MAG: double-strand break repair protein AddB [Croceibacterium sp.]